MDNRACYGPNAVIPRDTPNGIKLPAVRPRYSLQNFSLSAGAPPCATTDELVRAVEEGKYDGSGTFVTRCTIPVHGRLPRSRTCLQVEGDSFNRQMLIAVSMVLKDDFVSGGFDAPNAACVCDGQFSEHSVCRRNLSYPFPCESVWYDSYTRCQRPAAKARWRERCRGRPKFVWLQGGLHVGLNAARFAPTIRAFAGRLERTDRLLISGAHIQTAEADKRFPEQREARVREFNREVRRHAERAGAHFVDFAPLTEGRGTALSSDGVHYLTSVNLAKARIFLALLHMEA